MYGLETIDLEEPALLDRLLKNKVAENAYKEIQNRIATTPILAITPRSIVEHLAGYNISLNEAKPQLAPLLKRILLYFVVDRELTAKEAQEIQHLQALFNISDGELKQLQTDILLVKHAGAAKASLLSMQMAATVAAMIGVDDKPTNVSHANAEAKRRFYEKRGHRPYSTNDSLPAVIADKRGHSFVNWETPSEKQTPHQVLGIDEGATIEQIRAAYRVKAGLDHPDKASRLAPERRVMAEQKMKEINAAYQALRTASINPLAARTDQHVGKDYQSSEGGVNSEPPPADVTLSARVWSWLGWV